MITSATPGAERLRCKFSKWDADLAIALPEALAKRLQFREGDEIEIVAADSDRRSGAAASELTDKPTQEGDA